jgi:hypothetical protein
MLHQKPSKAGLLLPARNAGGSTVLLVHVVKQFAMCSTLGGNVTSDTCFVAYQPRIGGQRARSWGLMNEVMNLVSTKLVYQYFLLLCCLNVIRLTKYCLYCYILMCTYVTNVRVFRMFLNIFKNS